MKNRHLNFLIFDLVKMLENRLSNGDTNMKELEFSNTFHFVVDFPIENAALKNNGVEDLKVFNC